MLSQGSGYLMSKSLSLPSRALRSCLSFIAMILPCWVGQLYHPIRHVSSADLLHLE